MIVIIIIIITTTIIIMMIIITIMIIIIIIIIIIIVIMIMIIIIVIIIIMIIMIMIMTMIMLQLHIHSQLDTWLQWLVQRHLQDETRNIYVSGLCASCIRELTVGFACGAICRHNRAKPRRTFFVMKIGFLSRKIWRGLNLLYMFWLSCNCCGIGSNELNRS